MAFYDDRRWLLKHIRHSFITGDDSQLCEHVLLNNDFPLPKGDYDSDDDKVINDEDASAVLSESPDIFVGSARHRPRTYTAIRLEQMKKDRERTNAVRQVVWSMNQEDSPDEADLDEMFARKDVKPKRAVSKTSKLTEMLKDAPAVPPNPYTAYARFDGAHCFGEVPAKRIRIFVTMVPAPACFQPLEISIIPSAKVSDLIGLACWQYTSQRRQPPLPHDGVDAYRLLFAEEDGEFDYDFPPLEKTEVVSKFHFSSLALVEAATADASRSSVSATRSLVSLAKVVIMPSRDTVDVILPVTGGAGLTVSDLMRLTEEQCPDPKVVNRLKSKTFIVKEKGDPANALLSLNARITDCRSREFIFAPSETRAEEIRMRKHLNVMEAALYQSFTVSLMTRLGATTEIHLGISGEKIEVNPVTKSGGLIGMLVPSNAKPMTFNIDTIADCSIVDEKFGKKAVVRIVYKTPTGEYKHFDFECNHDIARTIDQKCKAILNLFGSATRQEYLESDFGRKPGRKWLFKKH